MLNSVQNGEYCFKMKRYKPDIDLNGLKRKHEGAEKRPFKHHYWKMSGDWLRD